MSGKIYIEVRLPNGRVDLKRRVWNKDHLERELELYEGHVSYSNKGYHRYIVLGGDTDALISLGAKSFNGDLVFWSKTERMYICNPEQSRELIEQELQRLKCEEWWRTHGAVQKAIGHPSVVVSDFEDAPRKMSFAGDAVKSAWTLVYQAYMRVIEAHTNCHNEPSVELWREAEQEMFSAMTAVAKACGYLRPMRVWEMKDASSDFK